MNLYRNPGRTDIHPELPNIRCTGINENGR
jgi:hypothetical protein